MHPALLSKNKEQEEVEMSLSSTPMDDFIAEEYSAYSTYCINPGH